MERSTLSLRIQKTPTSWETRFRSGHATMEVPTMELEKRVGGFNSTHSVRSEPKLAGRPACSLLSLRSLSEKIVPPLPATLKFCEFCEGSCCELMATVSTPAALPVLDSKSDAPPLFNGTPRLYISLQCPYAQRVWIARNFKRLENVELVAINLADKPKWYLEKVYPTGKVPSLEHDGKVKGESLDLLEYIDKSFEGPSLYPQETEKEEVAKSLLKFTDEFNKQVYTVLRNKEASKEYCQETLGPVLDHLEGALGTFSDEGPYFLGLISGVDFAYIPFLERYQLVLPEFFGYDLFEGRPRLLKWFEAMNTVSAYTSTKADPKELAERYKKMLGR